MAAKKQPKLSKFEELKIGWLCETLFQVSNSKDHQAILAALSEAFDGAILVAAGYKDFKKV